MSVVHAVLNLCVLTEQKPRSLAAIQRKLNSLKPTHYPSWLVIPAIGLACAAFSHLHGADWPGFLITFCAASLGMWARIKLAKRHYPALIVVAVVAFICTSVAGLANLQQFSQTGNIVISSSVLLLVPGFPFINAMLDAFKGYLSMGWGRWMQASLLTLMTSLGIILALHLFHLDAW